jgi:hypothetical protein
MRWLGFKHRLFEIFVTLAAVVSAALAAGAGYKH